MKTRGSPAGTMASAMPKTRAHPQDPYPRVKELRDVMREGGISDDVPIVMAGGVWRLDEWDDWIDNPELGQIVFQFGTRPLLTQESPIPPEWKARLMTLDEGDILLHKFSPDRLLFVGGAQPVPARARSAQRAADRLHQGARSAIIMFELDVGIGTKKNYWVTKGDLQHAREWYAAGFTNAHEDPRRHVGLRRARGGEDDPQGPGRLHGLPVAMQLLVAGRTMRRTRPGAWPIRAASASRRRSRTSPTAARSTRI